jgi:PAS domain S-box-containing protein
LGKTPCDLPFLPEEECLKVRQNVARVLKSGLPAENEVRHVAADGEERYFRNIYIPEFGLNGEVTGVLSIAHDIGERKAAEEALRASEERMRLFFERQLVGMAILSPEKSWIKVNDKACEMLGYSSDELNGLTWPKLTHPDDLAADEAQFERMLRGEIDSYTLEKRFVRKDGGIVAANIAVGCVRRSDRSLDYVLVLLEDITERKRNAKELVAARVILEAQNMQLHAYREKLEQRVEERTAELIASNQLLRVEIDERKQAERDLGELRTQLRGLLARREEAREVERKRIAREIHDELGQLLSGLQLSVSYLARQCGTDSPQMREHAEDAIELANKAVLVARNVASALRPVELEAGIVAALQLQARRFSAVTGIQCKFAFDDSEIRLNECSALAVYRIVQESLTNIAKHARASEVKIGLSKDAGDYVLTIRDDGIGFDTRAKKENSFGLVGIRERGLMLGGEVDIDSSPGGGTEIVVRIPEGKNCD